MSYKSLNINSLYIKSLSREHNDDLLSVGIYFLLLTIEGYDFLVLKELDKITGTDNSDIKLKIKSTLSNKNWLSIFNHLASSIGNESGQKFLFSLREEFKHAIETNPYSQSRISGRTAAMYKRTTVENANYIH
jgi:hypothetical protein